MASVILTLNFACRVVFSQFFFFFFILVLLSSLSLRLPIRKLQLSRLESTRVILVSLLHQQIRSRSRSRSFSIVIIFILNNTNSHLHQYCSTRLIALKHRKFAAQRKEWDCEWEHKQCFLKRKIKLPRYFDLLSMYLYSSILFCYFSRFIP